MKAFISYSHKDSSFLERLHTHLTQIKRDGKLTSWTDEMIPAGGAVNDHISNNLETSQIFIALLSPDYIASNYCYEKEFAKAIKMLEKGILIIIPIIVEPCDWLNTPFREFKALPKDGKAITDWSNENTAFLDVIQNLRKLIGNDEKKEIGVRHIFGIPGDFVLNLYEALEQDGFRCLIERAEQRREDRRE